MNKELIIIALPVESKKYSYEDYLNWPDEERWEIIEGIPYNMSPAPSRIHQKISTELSRQFANFLVNKPCEVYAAPFDVRLCEKNDKDNEIYTIVQPDIVVVCDKNKLDKKGCIGAPDLIIEIISPKTAGKDKKIKRELYERFKVREYWIVEPEGKTVEVYTNGKDSLYGKSSIYTQEDSILIGVLEGLEITLHQVFDG